MVKNIKQYTMQDVAKKAEVSIATVSHVVNKTRFVEEDTKKRVLDAIKELNYTISLNASSLRGKKTKLIGLVIPDVSNPVFSKLCRNIENVFFKKDYSVTLCNSEGNLEREIIYTDILKSRNVDGIIILPTSYKYDHLNSVIDAGIKLILIEREIKGLDANRILVDGFSGYYEATKYLIGLGHEKIGFIRRPYDLSHSILRFNGYFKALKDLKISFVKEFCPRASNFTYSGGYFAMNKIMDLKDCPTAILAFDDVVAIGAMKAIKDRGFCVPGDFSIIGFDNIMVDEYMESTLSSITFPTEAISKEALKIFFSNSGDTNKLRKRVVLQPKIKIRDSVSAPRVK